MPREAFAADILDQSDEALADEEIDALYAEHLDEVQRVQATERSLLRELIRHRDLWKVFCEGITDSDMPAYRVIIGYVRRRQFKGQALLKNRELLDETFLRVGATGQLLAVGELVDALPAEDEGAYAQANPLAAKGQLVLDGPANDARQLAIVRRMLEFGPMAVVVLSGGHDLSTQVKQLGGCRCEYIKLTPPHWPFDEPVAER